MEMGDLSFSALDENGGKVTVELSDVRLAPDVDIALISASQLIGAGFEVILGTPPRLKIRLDLACRFELRTGSTS